MKSSFFLSPDWPELTLDALCRRIPCCDGAVKVGVVCHVARNGGVVAEDFVLDHMLARLYSAEKVCDVIGGVVVALRRGVGFHLGKLDRLCRMGSVPFLQIL